MLVSSGGAQNCASKLRVTILLRDPFTIPDQDAEKGGVVSPLLRNVRMDRKMFVRIGRAPMREMVRLGRSQEENTEDM